MATASVNSILLSSDDPDALSRWYGTVFEGTVHRDGGPYAVLDLDGFFVMFDRREDVTGSSTNGPRLILNVEVDDPVATAARIDEFGGHWISPLQMRDGNHFGTAADPDGNWIQLVRLSDETEVEMSAPTTPFSGFAVRDIDAAADFYSSVLGMRVVRNDMGILGISIDRRTKVIAYPKPDHVPASFTILNLPVDDVDASVAELAGKGVTFVHYEGMPQDANGVMRDHGPTIAWFTDPSGNVLSLIERS